MIAITSTSHNTFLGNVSTATQLLAGFCVKYFAYTSLNAAKSAMLSKKQVDDQIDNNNSTLKKVEEEKKDDDTGND